jgi:hypothetical protein
MKKNCNGGGKGLFAVVYGRETEDDGVQRRGGAGISKVLKGN